MNKEQFRARYSSLLQELELRLSSLLTDKAPQAELLESMRYSLLSGGKRIRPIITLEFCSAVCGSHEQALDAACAVEMLHTYSLIHDDLPCMDNDTMRRGRATNHIVYGECTATLAGDALQASAFEVLLVSELPADRVVNMARSLAHAAGPYGMCGGQYLDMKGEGRALSEGEISQLQSMKTAALLIAAAEMGVYAAGGTSQQISAAREYASAVGRAFQIRDDLLDVTATTEQLGKDAGSDAESGKSTYAAIYGVRKCEELIAQETERASRAVLGAFGDAEFLHQLAHELAERNS